MSVDYDPPSGMDEALAVLVRDQIRAKAEAVLHTAQVTAPVDTGAYKNSLHIEDAGPGFRVVANVNHAAYVEFGTRRMQAYRTLGRALDAAKNA